MLLLVAATPFEIAPTLSWLEKNPPPMPVEPLITGVGPVAAAWALGRRLAAAPQPAWCLQAGVAGAFDRRLALGEVVHVISERFADIGVEEADDSFTDVFELGLTDRDEAPFSGGVLHDPGAARAAFLPQVHGLTASTVHGYAPSIEAIRARFPDAQVESMEGASFFYACRQAAVSFLQIRAISNYVEPRNRATWELGRAIEQLNRNLTELISAL